MFNFIIFVHDTLSRKGQDQFPNPTMNIWLLTACTIKRIGICNGQWIFYINLFVSLYLTADLQCNKYVTEETYFTLNRVWQLEWINYHWNIFTVMGHCLWADGDDGLMFINSLRPRLNRRPFADDIFICIFLNENVWIPIKISLKIVPKGAINIIQALVQIMAWRRPGDKPLSEPMMISLTTHICLNELS